MDRVLVVSEAATDITVKVVRDGRGFLHVLSEADGKMVPLPKMTPQEARALAAMLSRVSGESDQK
jgi:hypothetical protein